MKYLMYLVKQTNGSSDEDDWDYVLKKYPPEYDHYKTVVIEVVEEGSQLKDIMGR